MGTKMAVAFTNIFIAKVETKILKQNGLTGRSSGNHSSTTTSSSGTTRGEVTQFIEQANKHHQTIKITNFFDTTVYKDERFNTESVQDVRTHVKLTETFTTPIFQLAVHQK